MTRELVIPKVRATVQQATVNIPFKIDIQGLEKAVTDLIPFRWWQHWSTITTPLCARGIIKFYDELHGYLDHGDFVNVQLAARRVWERHFRTHIELKGMLRNIGRYCFTGWGICDMEVYDSRDNSTAFHVMGRVETEIL